MSRTATRLFKDEVDNLLHFQGVILDQPFVEGRTLRASFRDSQGLSFVSSVSKLLSQPRKNYTSGTSALVLQEQQQHKTIIETLEKKALEKEEGLKKVIEDLKNKNAKLQELAHDHLDVMRKNFDQKNLIIKLEEHIRKLEKDPDLEEVLNESW